MSLIDKDNALNWVIKALDKNFLLEIKSYKRNRTIKIFKKGLYFQIVENGFWKENFQVKKEELRKILKKLIRREFPRSHKLWIFKG
ncbi:MAG TPA: hypothetical protein ENG63_04810 [Candidatus Desulfofervidus auxilii]|uniref:Uncharacterized protein n=1 Tax=Desulfofervidus auxilii TaxID=1621989 RepID=A0A7C0U2D1_DESA2|nr:hypothetical protein [Candidatus Desulfofervidus auxilii]